MNGLAKSMSLLKVVWNKDSAILVDSAIKEEVEQLVRENESDILKAQVFATHRKDGLTRYVSFHISTYGRKGDREGGFELVCMFGEMWIAWDLGITKSREANQLLYQTVATVKRAKRKTQRLEP